MRVLVTGGCGFIGSHLVRRLVAGGAEVVVLDDLSTGARHRLFGTRCELLIGSVTDRAAVSHAMRGCSLVFHLAGLVGMELVTRAPAAAHEVAVRGAVQVFRAARCARVVMLSSSCVYGHERELCRESDPIDRATAIAFDGGRPGYATGKWDMEHLAAVARAGGTDVLVVRPFNVIGEGQLPDHRMVVPRFVCAAQRGEPLVVYGDGEQSRTFSYVADFVDALAGIAASPCWGDCGHLVNLGNPRPTTILELATAVIAARRSPSRVEFRPYADRFPGHRDVRRRVPDVSRVEGILGRVVWTPLPEVVARLTHGTELPRYHHDAAAR